MVSVAVQDMTEAAGEHKGDAWKMPTDVLPERYAVETGHDHVAEYNIEALRFLVDQLQRLLRVGSKHRLIAEIAKAARVWPPATLRMVSLSRTLPD